jgi:hypothetical protein
MTAKELLLQEAPTWTEEQAERALRAVKEDPEGDSETAWIPESWRTFEDGTPAPDWEAAVRRSREAH